MKNLLWDKALDWLSEELNCNDMPVTDFERMSYELRPCDVLLVDGQTRVSEVIKLITQSAWTHSALYIGRLHDIDSPALRERIKQYYDGDPGAQLVVESLLGQGTIVTPLSYYRDFHLRICRPRGIARQDAQQVIGYAINRLGADYDVRQLLDIARFMLPYAVLPRRWRSSLFEYHPGQATRCICSTMMAEAFQSVNFPILPVMHRSPAGETALYKRNPRLYTPKDFDYSPYFDIIKYPFYGVEDPAIYRDMPWRERQPKSAEISASAGSDSAASMENVRNS